MQDAPSQTGTNFNLLPLPLSVQTSSRQAPQWVQGCNEEKLIEFNDQKQLQQEPYSCSPFCEEQTVHQKDLENLQKIIVQTLKYCQAKKSKQMYIRNKKIQQLRQYQEKLVCIIRKKSEETIQTLSDFSNGLINEEFNLSESKPQNQRKISVETAAEGNMEETESNKDSKQIVGNESQFLSHIREQIKSVRKMGIELNQSQNSLKVDERKRFRKQRDDSMRVKRVKLQKIKQQCENYLQQLECVPSASKSRKKPKKGLDSEDSSSDIDEVDRMVNEMEKPFKKFRAYLNSIKKDLAVSMEAFETPKDQMHV